MFMKKVFAMLVVISMGAISLEATAADASVAFVNVARLLKEAPQVKKMRADIKKEFSRRDEQLVAQQQQLKKLQEKLARDAAIMKEAEVKRLERDILSRRRQLKSAQGEFQEDLALRQNEKLKVLRKLIAEVIIDVAKQQKVDVVLEGGVVWASDRVNMTDKVLAQLKKQ